MSILGTEYPEVFHHFAALTFEAAVAHGVEAEAAASIGRDVANAIRSHFGGDNIYIPKVATALYGEIYRRWNMGVDARTLSREYGYSVQHINAIVKPLRDRDRGNQKGLFDGLDELPPSD